MKKTILISVLSLSFLAFSQYLEAREYDNPARDNWLEKWSEKKKEKIKKPMKCAETYCSLKHNKINHENGLQIEKRHFGKSLHDRA